MLVDLAQSSATVGSLNKREILTVHVELEFIFLNAGKDLGRRLEHMLPHLLQPPNMPLC